MTLQVVRGDLGKILDGIEPVNKPETA